MNGLQMLLRTFGIELDPAEMQKTVLDFRGLVLRLATAVEHVEAQQRAIMRHLGIDDIPASTEQNHGRSEINGNADRNANAPAN